MLRFMEWHKAMPSFSQNVIQSRKGPSIVPAFWLKNFLSDLSPKWLVLGGVLVDQMSEFAGQGDESPRKDQTLDLEELEQIHHVIVDVLHLPTTIDDANGVIDGRYLGFGWWEERKGN